MSVILGSEIARLVFGYLQEEHLDEAATAFCKTSPYLGEEYDWLQRGYRAFKISDLCLVDIIREHCEIKYAVAEYIESLPLSMGDTLKVQKSLSGKINCIFDLLTNSSSQPSSVSRKRPYSMIGSTEATQSTELPGYEPPFKERRLSRKLIMRRDSTPKQNQLWTPTTKQNAHEVYASDDQDEENMSPEQVNSMEKSRNETSQYPIFTETILENTQFQNVLVENINRMLETSSDRIDVSVASGSQDPTCNNNNSLQEQEKNFIDNIIMSTERDPTFQQVLDDVVQYTAIQDQTIRTTSGVGAASDGNEKIDSPVPLKQRLRNRSQDKPRPNYNEIDQGSKKKRKAKVEVISNEIVSGEISDLLHPNTTERGERSDSYVPLNQILYLNSDRNTTTYGQDLVYVNVGVPTFRIDADTPMFLQDISLANNGTSTSITPSSIGSIINIPTIEQQIQPIQSMMPNVIIKDIVEVSKTKQIERSIKTTPSVSKNMLQAKARTLSSPRRHSHVRSLNFATSDDVTNENERLKTTRSDNDKKSEPADSSGSATTTTMPHTANNTDSAYDDLNQKTSLEEVEPQQDSSDAVDFSKEFDEATVISVELSATAEATNGESSKEEKPAEVSSEKKKPQTRRQCQKDLEMWNQMRQMKKGEWDNYLRQTVASNPGSIPVDKKKIKKRKSKIPAKSSDEANVSIENGTNTSIEMEARLLEEALQSTKKTAPSAIKTSSTPDDKITEDTKAPNDSEPLNPTSSSAVSAQKSEVKNPRSPNKRSSGGRKKLIQIKLPASAKKKVNMPIRRKSKPVVKRAAAVLPAVKVEKRAAETTRIDPSQSIDIDLISPIEHPTALNNVVKSGVNLNSFLETPCKESSSFKFPITPGFAISSIKTTPGLRQLKDYDSLIKFPEYPTPSFAITPGRTKTPLSQSSSQKEGSSYNRATDYSSGSSYYKPDESDDVDKNLDVLIKENRTQAMSVVGVDPQQNIIFCNDREPASDGELSDSSTSSSSTSQSSSSTTCTSSPSTSADEQTAADDANKLAIAQRTQQQLKLEQVRLRTMATIKSDKNVERFRKPKTKISSLLRNKIIDGACMMKKPVQTLKMTGNSTPKVAPKVLPKHVSKPNNPKTSGTTPSKRKIATPRRVIYLDYKDAVKTTVRVMTHDNKKPADQIQSQSNDAKRDTLKPIPDTHPPRPVTPTETIDAIESHIAKTCLNSSVDFAAAKSTQESQIDTPNLLHQLQSDKTEATDNASTPEMGPPTTTTTKRATLVRELFGDGTMSDSDFMDTPVKAVNKSQTQTKVVPISQAANEVSLDSITREVTAKKSVPNSPNCNDKRSNAAVSKIVDAESIESESKDSKVDDSKADETKADDSKLVSSIDLTDSVRQESVSDNSIGKDLKRSDTHDSPNKHPIDNGSADNDTIAKLPIAVDTTSMECNKVSAQSISIDSDSESDDGDDYDDCTLIPAFPKTDTPNRIYHKVVSNTKECAIKSNTERLDLRPVALHLDANTVVKLTACDEVTLYSSAPKAAGPSPTASSAAKGSAKPRTNMRMVERVKKVEERYKKVQKLSLEGTDNSVPEKNARFNIVAKHKGPVDVPSSSQTSSSRDQRKILSPAEESQPNAGTSNEMKKSSQQHTKIPPLLKDMDINKVLGKIHPSKEIV